MTHYNMPEQYVDIQLEDFVQQLKDGPYPAYPPETKRLVADIHTLGRTATDAIIFPEGPWFVSDTRNMRKDVCAPGAAEHYRLAHEGYQLDNEGRPLHPWFARMVSDPNIGVLGGKGAYWGWGPNHTADSVVVHRGKMLLIQREDTGDWALPGGFVNNGELARIAAPREVKEETGVDLSFSWGNPIYHGPVVDLRMTAHAWPETSAFLYSVDDEHKLADPKGDDDARSAQWVPLEDISNLKLFGSHRFLAELALSQLNHLKMPTRYEY